MKKIPNTPKMQCWITYGDYIYIYTYLSLSRADVCKFEDEGEREGEKSLG